MKKNGCNVTPGDLKPSQVEKLYSICDPFFTKVLDLYDVKTIVAVGKFCETRARKAIKKYLPSSNIEILYLPHPSPRSVNNNDWNKKAVECLKKLDLLQYYSNTNE
ncbi:single-strand selective monofunctional uracil DNA glycosylase [Hyposmocoma kahamanoa]|uniref:single-strand selective monofunctional uracil DNA glycosylase n=1 Tax=Hyposmocoma kahamanoa TaxID=1477025 RepID=UPI000E6D5FBB|nr:single-strand selective monofunctional uracil DNA glycosylase [Hyposmocoma kahamanoa]